MVDDSLLCNLVFIRSLLCGFQTGKQAVNLHTFRGDFLVHIGSRLVEPFLRFLCVGLIGNELVDAVCQRSDRSSGEDIRVLHNGGVQECLRFLDKQQGVVVCQLCRSPTSRQGCGQGFQGVNGNQSRLVNAIRCDKLGNDLAHLFVVLHEVCCRLYAARDDALCVRTDAVQHIVNRTLQIGYGTLDALALRFEHIVELAALCGGIHKCLLDFACRQGAGRHFLFQLSD